MVRPGSAGAKKLGYVWQNDVKVREEQLAVCCEECVSDVGNFAQDIHIFIIFIQQLLLNNLNEKLILSIKTNKIRILREKYSLTLISLTQSFVYN